MTGPRPSLAEDLALALEMADVADRLTTDRFRASDLKVDTKPDLTPVTEADRGVEEALRKLMAERRPGDAVVGEEYGATGGVGARRWIVDPIDGTKNFVRGIPVWASLIALEDAGRPVVGVVSAPALGRRWWAASGLGAFADGSPISVSSVARLEDAQLSYSSLDGWAEQGGTGPLLALGERCWRTRAFGDFWSHVLVAEGAVDIGLDPIVSLWDLAAVQVIVEEAGGRFTDYGGVRTADGGSAVSTNGLLHDEVLRILRPT